MTGLRVTKQQFSDAVKKFGIGFIPSGRIYDSIRDAGLVLVDKQALCEKLDEAIQSVGKYLCLGEGREHPNKTFLRTEDLLKKMKVELLGENKK